MPTLLQLSSAHRAGQDRIARALAVALLASYRQKITGTQSDTVAEAWARQMVPLILAYRARSERLAGSFYERSRAVALPSAPPVPRAAADDVPAEAIFTSLYVTGVIGVTEKLTHGATLVDALKEGATAANGAGSRHALEGGRSFTRNLVTLDPVAVGFFRQTRGGCCSFCALLASRGAVYKEDSFRDSDPAFADDPDMPSTDKVHDHCHCTLQPVYRRGESPLDEAPDLNRQFRQLWEDTVRDPATGRTLYSGKDALNAFRRAYEHQG